MKSRFNKFWNKFLCYHGIHNMIKGISWCAEMRYDVCKNCTYSRYKEDNKGYKLWLFKIQTLDETRRVLFEKMHNECRSVKHINGDFKEVGVLQEKSELIELGIITKFKKYNEKNSIFV